MIHATGCRGPTTPEGDLRLLANSEWATKRERQLYTSTTVSLPPRSRSNDAIGSQKLLPAGEPVIYTDTKDFTND